MITVSGGAGVLKIKRNLWRRLSADNVHSTWGRCSVHIHKEMQRYIRGETTPKGRPWAKRIAGGKALDGWENKVKVKVRGRTIWYGVKHKWSRLHNSGMTIRSKNAMVFMGIHGWVRTKKVVIPPRQFLAQPSFYTQAFNAIFLEHVFTHGE